MTIAQQLLGQANFVAAASGQIIDMRDYGAVTFLSFLDAGTQSLTFTQHTDDGTGSPGTETALATTNDAYKAPGTGGTWSAGPTPSSGVYDLSTDAVNDAMVITIRADQLSDNNRFIECTADSGILTAICHDLDHQLPATAMPTPIGS